MLQVAGRADRKEKQGTVLVQTFNDEHEILKLLKKMILLGCKNEASQRKLFSIHHITD